MGNVVSERNKGRPIEWNTNQNNCLAIQTMEQITFIMYLLCTLQLLEELLIKVMYEKHRALLFHHTFSLYLVEIDDLH